MNTVVVTEPFVHWPRPRSWCAKIENAVGATALVLMVALPVIDLIARLVSRTGLPGAVEYTQHLSLWVGFVGAALAARERQHLSLVTQTITGIANRRGVLPWLLATTSCAVALCLAFASWHFVTSEMQSPLRVAGWLPVWTIAVILPVSFTLIAIRFSLQAGDTIARLASMAVACCAAGALLLLEDHASILVWPIAGALIVGGILGLPIFIMIGGIALALFFADSVPVAALPVEAYRLVVSPSIPAIPLFTLCGFILASGGAAARLVRLFRALFGWLPGGTIVAVTLVCAFFSTFTGASGVTILALGGLLLPALMQNGNSARFSLGLLTSTGSIGLLFPPSLAIILYGVAAQVPINDLFRAGALPGLVMVGAVAAYGIFVAKRNGMRATPFDGVEALAALWHSRWELLLPVVVLTVIFGGFASLIEAAAISACYALVVATCVHRDVRPSELMPILVKCATLLGGVFAIIGVAMGLTSYLVDAMVPMKLVAWVEAHVESRVVFLLALNLLLLIVGCLMDIFSAIFVVLPLIIPVSEVFHIDPLHLGIIFLINLELGYLTPPVGMNLFLAAYRLEKPILEVYRSVVPFLCVLFVVLMLITFIPELTLGWG